MIGRVWLTGEFDMLETVLAVRLGTVDGVENPGDDNGAGMARLSRTGGVGADDEDGVGIVSVSRHLVIRIVLSVSCEVAFCCLFSHSAERVCTCFSPGVSFLLVASSAV